MCILISYRISYNTAKGVRLNKLIHYAKRFLPKSVESFKKKEIIFPVLLTTLCLLILFVNRVPDTILSGWDTLHPEFNFSLNFSRLIFGVWREEQGLGAVAAHAHMSDLPRVILLWLSSFIFPLNFLRFLYIGACLISGVLGSFFFIKKYIFEKSRYAEFFAFLGALFYLINLVTVQQFYVPFEMFTTQYALLPWLFYSALRYLNNSAKKNLALFGIISFFASPMAYAPLLWYAYFAGLVLFLLPFLKSQKKSVITLVGISLLINLYWILPNLYFLISGNAAKIPEAKINQIFSEEAYLQNASFSNPLDVAIFKNFLFNWPVYSGFNRFDFLLSAWRKHLENPFVLTIAYFNFSLVILGILVSIKKRKKITAGLLSATIFCLIFLLSSTPPVSYFSNFLRDHFSLIKEAFRFPFTKFSIITMFGFSIFFAIGTEQLFNLIAKIKFWSKNLKPALIIFTILFTVNFIVYGFPVFQGQLISKYMQLKIPAEYFQLFDYLNSKPDGGRVMVLPAHSMWGWSYYDWGFQGAQFITFGIKQPVLDRDWDRWNPGNEQFYREFSYALYSQNNELLKSVLEKYNVHYLVVDKHIIDPGKDSDAKILYFNEIELLLQNLSGDVVQRKEFKNINIYTFKKEGSSMLTSPLQIAKQKFFGNMDIDKNYLNSQDYISTESGAIAGLKTNNLNLIDPSTVSFSENQLIINNTLANDQSYSRLIKTENVIPFNIYTKREGDKVLISLTYAHSDSLAENGIKLEFKVPTDENLLLNIDKYQTLELKPVSGQEYTYQGIGFVNIKQFNNISLYQSNQSSGNSIPLDVFQTNNFDRTVPGIIKSEYPVDLCQKAGEDQIFGAEFTNEGVIKIAAKNSSACVWVPLSKVINSANITTSFKNLLTLSFNTNANDNVFGRFCLYDMGRKRCVKEQKYLLNQNSVKDYFLAEGEELNKLNLVFYLDGVNNGKLEEISYSNLSLTVTNPHEVISISPDEIYNYLNNLTVNHTTNGQSLFYNRPLITPIDLFETGHELNDCTNLPGNLAFRNSKKEQGFIEFHSKQGSFCDYYSFPNLSHSTGYLLKIDSENISGLPLRICLANPYNKRCDVYTIVPKAKGTNLIMIPPMKDGGVGYDIHFDNYAVGNFETVNRIYSLELLPIPYYYLNEPEQSSTQNAAVNNILLKNQTTIFPGIYLAGLNNSSGIVALDQSFENGWWSPNGKHILLNGWQNGWQINEGQQNLTIIYLPELLGILAELISFSLVLSFLINIFKTINKPDTIPMSLP